MSDTYLVFDIETAANARAPDYYKSKTYEAPSNYKDPAKIEAAILEKRQADMERAALSWWTGRVLCVSATPVNGPAALISATFSGVDEREVLLDFFDYLAATQARGGGRVIPIGKASDIFDIPFLIGRAMAHDLGVPDCLRGWRKLTDVDLIFGPSSGLNQRGRLSDYAWGLQSGAKLAHGSGVAAMWLDIQMGLPGAWDVLTAYCEQDVAITADILRKYLKPYLPREGVPGAPATPEDKPLDIPF